MLWRLQFHRKTLVLEPLFNKAAVLGLVLFYVASGTEPNLFTVSNKKTGRAKKLENIKVRFNFSKIIREFS